MYLLINSKLERHVFIITYVITINGKNSDLTDVVQVL